MLVSFDTGAIQNFPNYLVNASFYSYGFLYNVTHTGLLYVFLLPQSSSSPCYNFPNDVLP